MILLDMLVYEPLFFDSRFDHHPKGVSPFFVWRKPTSRVEKLQDLLFSLSLQAEAEEILELLNSTVSFCPRDIILDTERVFWGPGGRVTELLWRKMKLWI